MNSDAISTISHKLRTPMTVIVSTVNNFLDGAYGRLNGEQQKWLKKLDSHTTHLEALLTELMDLLKASQAPDIVAQHLGNAQSVSAAPAKSAETTPDPKKSPLSAVSRVPTVLVVDDEPDILDVMK